MEDEKVERAYIINEKGFVKVFNAEIIGLCSNKPNSKPTHACIKYYDDFDSLMIGENAVYQIIPLERVFYASK